MSANPIADLTVPDFNATGLTAASQTLTDDPAVFTLTDAVKLIRDTLAAAPSTQSQITYGAGQSLGEVISALSRIGA